MFTAEMRSSQFILSRKTSFDASRGMFYFNSIARCFSAVRKFYFRCKIIGKEKPLYEQRPPAINHDE